MAATLLMFCVATPAGAEEVTFYFQGVLTEDGGFSPACGGLLGGGTSFTGSFTFESTTPDIHPAPQQSIHPQAIVAASLELDGVAYDLVDGAIQFQDDYSTDASLCGGALHDQLSYSVNVTTRCAQTHLPSPSPASIAVAVW